MNWDPPDDPAAEGAWAMWEALHAAHPWLNEIDESLLEKIVHLVEDVAAESRSVGYQDARADQAECDRAAAMNMPDTYLMLLADYGSFPFGWEKGDRDVRAWPRGMYYSSRGKTLLVSFTYPHAIDPDPRLILDAWLAYNYGTTMPEHPPLVLGLWRIDEQIDVDALALHAGYVERHQQILDAEAEAKERTLLASLKAKYEKGP